MLTKEIMKAARKGDGEREKRDTGKIDAATQKHRYSRY
jgi:hypothetical protein